MVRSIAVVLGLLGLSACTEAVPTSPAGIERARAGGAPTALYDAFPLQLFDAHAQVCNEPGETVVRPSYSEIRCEALMPPDITGSLILEFDGTVEDLPRLVTAFIVQDAEDAFLVIADSYIRIPQREGGIREIRLNNPEMQSTLRELFRRSGGRPL